MIFLSAANMKEEFLISYDRVANQAAPGYEDNEISLFLSTAQDRLLKTRLNPKGNKYQESLEQTEKRRKDFSELIRDAVDTSGTLTTAISANQNGALPNGTFFDLPEDFLFAWSERIETDILCDGSNKVVSVKPVTHDQYNINKDNPWKKPNNNLAWRLDFSQVVVGSSGTKRHEIITDGSYQVTKYLLRYVKVPRDIDIANNISCELNASVHREIVDLAVEIALETVMDPRFQTKKIENQEFE